MKTPPDHVIVMTEISDERTAWECDCGRAGSAATWKVDFAAEAHVKPGQTVAHRSSGGGTW